MLRSIIQNVSYAARRWRRALAVAFTVIAVLALGLGANIAVFTIHGVRAHDTLTFVAVEIVLAAASFFAAWLPARRAAAVDPILALRSE